MSVAAVIARTVGISVSLLIMIRLMGLREIGQLSPFDFVVAITLGSIAASPLIRGEVAIEAAAVSMVVFSALHIGLSCLSTRYPAIERLVAGTPTAVIENGNVRPQALKKLLMNCEELLSLLRLAGAESISDVQTATVETNGRLSVQLKSASSPVTPPDMGLNGATKGLSAVLIDDGQVKHDALSARGLNEEWLHEQLAQRNIRDPQSVLLAVIDAQGRLHVTTRKP